MVKEGVLANPRVDAAFALHIDAKREVNRSSTRRAAPTRARTTFASP